MVGRVGTFYEWALIKLRRQKMLLCRSEWKRKVTLGIRHKSSELPCTILWCSCIYIRFSVCECEYYPNYTIFGLTLSVWVGFSN